MKGKIFPCAFVCLFLVGVTQAQNNLRVNETETTAILQANRLQMNLAVENPFRAFQAGINLEVLNAKDEVLAKRKPAETQKRQAKFIFST